MLKYQLLLPLLQSHIHWKVWFRRCKFFTVFQTKTWRRVFVKAWKSDDDDDEKANASIIKTISQPTCIVSLHSAPFSLLCVRLWTTFGTSVVYFLLVHTVVVYPQSFCGKLKCFLYIVHKFYLQCLQCIDAVGWATGRASGL